MLRLIIIQIVFFSPYLLTSQQCYTEMGSNSSSNIVDCPDFDEVYSSINSVKILPRFHFIKYNDKQFECDHSNPN